MTSPTDRSLPASLGGLVLPGGGREVARVLRWVRVATAAVVVLLAATTWRDAWPAPGVSATTAAAVLGAWLLATNVWSAAHDRGDDESAGTLVEVLSDVALALTLTVVGGHLVAETLPLLGVLVVVEVAVRLPRGIAYATTAGYVAVTVVTIALRWPSWAGWQPDHTVTDLLPALIALPTALVLVAHLAADRAETRSVAIGQARRLALVARELREANARLARTNEDLSSFAGRLAHDLRNPLGTVVTALETLRRPGLELDPGTRDQLVGRSLRAANRSVAIVDALLDHAIAEGRAADVAPVDLVDVAAEVVATLPADLLGTVRVDLPAGPARVWADARLLPLVLQNLLANALTHGGGDLRRITVAAEDHDDGVVVTVADDGVGIADALRGEAFTAGTGDGPRRGLGLGLATCHSIVVRHGGRIWIDDSELGGAAVRFWLPRPADLVVLDDAPAAPQRTLATSSSSGSSSRTSVPS